MSYDDFVKFKGLAIKHTTCEEAHLFVSKRGKNEKDFCRVHHVRNAFWDAIYWSDKVLNLDLNLHARCSAFRKARTAWKHFVKEVVPVVPEQPEVPPLPQ
jgi:hypothetical protein